VRLAQEILVWRYHDLRHDLHLRFVRVMRFLVDLGRKQSPEFGLVPMATQQLIRFSTDGDGNFENGINALDILVHKVDRATQRQFAGKERLNFKEKAYIFLVKETTT
jgi:hypothetical protein